MACRMLVAIGDFPLTAILDGFLSMARNKNEEHEYRDRPDHVHGDGWGVVTGRSGTVTCYRSTSACWADPAFARLYGVEVDLIMLHARRASPGIAVRYEFTHPFEQDGSYFCHNGRVYDFGTEERSDSQQLFALILENLSRSRDVAEATRRTVGSLKDYSAVNFILSRDDQVYVLNQHGTRGKRTPNYYTMRYLQTSDYAIVSSEKLPGLDRGWQAMKNGTLATLSMPDRSLELSRL